MIRVSSVWSPASQEFSPVGNAGVGVVSLGGAPLALPTFATPGFANFFGLGRATISAKMITEMRGADFIVFRINKNGNDCNSMRF